MVTMLTCIPAPYPVTLAYRVGKVLRGALADFVTLRFGENPGLRSDWTMSVHLNQHKGQLFYYLKLMGEDVKTEDLWGK
jgi:hypothetical protein